MLLTATWLFMKINIFHTFVNFFLYLVHVFIYKIHYPGVGSVLLIILVTKPGYFQEIITAIFAGLSRINRMQIDLAKKPMKNNYL